MRGETLIFWREFQLVEADPCFFRQAARVCGHGICSQGETRQERLANLKEAIPRHSDIKKHLARSICQSFGLRARSSRTAYKSFSRPAASLAVIKASRPKIRNSPKDIRCVMECRETWS